MARAPVDAVIPVQDADDPIVQAQQMIAEARQAFARDVDELLGQLRVFTQAWGDGGSITLVSRTDALLALRELVLEKFAQRVAPPRSLADAVLIQLLREAFELLNDADTRLDLREWTKAARLVLGEPETT